MLNLMMLLFLSINPKSYGFAKAWFSCTKSEDCVKTLGACGRAGSINVQFKDKYELFMKKTKDISSCPPMTSELLEVDEKAIPVCVKTQCELTHQ